MRKRALRATLGVGWWACFITLIYSATGNAEEPSQKPHVVLIAAEDEYNAAESLAQFARRLETQHHCQCTLLVGDDQRGVSGLEALGTADALVLYVRRKALPIEQMAKIHCYLDAGKPLVALRTTSHAFDIRNEPPKGWAIWPTFDHEVLGGNYHGHYGAGHRTVIRIGENAATHPIIAGLNINDWTSNSVLYKVSPVAPDATVLLIGECNGNLEPIAWTRNYHGGRIFYTSLGNVDDFQSSQFCTLLTNAIYWVMDRQKPNEPGKTF